MTTPENQTAKVLLVAMPWIHPTSTSLALGLLSELLSQQGLATDCLHAALLYPRTPLWDFESGVRFLVSYGGMLFGAYLAPDVVAYQEPFKEYMLKDYMAERSLHGLIVDPQQGESDDDEASRSYREYVAGLMAQEIRNAGICLDRCEERAADPSYDVVGFSITFFTQLAASVALAQRLKAKNPRIKIMFGGSGCVAEQAEGMMRSFPVIDAVCYTEADDLIGRLVSGLRGEHDLASVPGIVYRQADGSIARTEEPELRRDLDSLPLPNHDSYFTQHAASEWHDFKPIVFFETSRGCWWGQKHLCTFCGLSERELAFRSKSPDRMYDEIVTLYERYPGAEYLHPTDDILDTRYFNTLLPRLAARPKNPQRPLRMFFEVKANMRAAQLLLLARAGVVAIQPGIESFSDEILRLMDKGCTAMNQVQFIKWATQAGIKLIYNILVRNPGETANAYREMSELIPYLQHLPPPNSILIVELERFSPYFRRAEQFGITNIKPKGYHQLVFPQPGVDHYGIAYRFTFDHPCKTDPELITAQREFVARVQHWRKSYKPSQRYFFDRGDHIILVDERSGSPRTEILAGNAAELYRYIDTHRPFHAIATRFPHLDEAFLRTQLLRWQQQGVAYSSRGDEHVALLPRAYERALTLDDILAANKLGQQRPTRKAGEPVRLSVLQAGGSPAGGIG